MTNEQKMRAALEKIVGASDPDELRAMRDVLVAVKSDDEQLVASIHAIDFLLETHSATPTALEQIAAERQRGKETQRSISDWANGTFGPTSSNARVAARANEEMAELLRALTTDDASPLAPIEAADVVIVLYRLCDRMGVDLHAAIDAKMMVNRERVWRIEGGQGQHVRDKELP